MRQDISHSHNLTHVNEEDASMNQVVIENNNFPSGANITELFPAILQSNTPQSGYISGLDGEGGMPDD